MTELPIEFLSHVFITQTLTAELAPCLISRRSISSTPKARLLGWLGLAALRVQGVGDSMGCPGATGRKRLLPGQPWIQSYP